MSDPSVFTYRTDTGNIKTLRILGHRILCRRCKMDERDWLVGNPDNATPCPSVQGQNAQELVDRAIATYTTHSDTYVAEVLAVGPDVNKPRTNNTMKRFHIPQEQRRGKRIGQHYWIQRHTNCPVAVGDYVILPESSEHQLMWRPVTESRHDVLIDCEEIIAYSPGDSANARNN